MRLYKSITANVEMVLVEGEVFVRTPGQSFVHISQFEKPTGADAQRLFDNCARQCQSQASNSFHSVDFQEDLAKLESDAQRLRDRIEGIRSTAQAAYDAWVKA